MVHYQILVTNNNWRGVDDVESRVDIVPNIGLVKPLHLQADTKRSIYF